MSKMARLVSEWPSWDSNPGGLALQSAPRAQVYCFENSLYLHFAFAILDSQKVTETLSVQAPAAV